MYFPGRIQRFGPKSECVEYVRVKKKENDHVLCSSLWAPKILLGNPSLMGWETEQTRKSEVGRNAAQAKNCTCRTWRLIYVFFN